MRRVKRVAANAATAAAAPTPLQGEGAGRRSALPTQSAEE